MKLNWRSFMFSMGVLLFALISVNLISSGVKLEGFEEGAGDVKANCQKQVTTLGNKMLDFDADIKKLHEAKTLYNGNNVDYSKLTKYGDAKTLGGACSGYITSKYKAPAAPKQVAVAAKPVPKPAAGKK